MHEVPGGHGELSCAVVPPHGNFSVRNEDRRTTPDGEMVVRGARGRNLVIRKIGCPTTGSR